MQHLIPVLCTAVVVGILLRRLRLPAAMLVGGFLSIAAWSMFVAPVPLPAATRVFAQAMSGSFVGMSVRREDLTRLKAFILPTICLLTGYFFATLFLGVLVWLVSPLDLFTAFLCVAPGGVGELALTASDYGANASAVTVLQVSRNVIGTCVFPALIRLMCRKDDSEHLDRPILRKADKLPRKTVLLSLTLIIAFGVLGRISGVAAGSFLFAVFGVALLRLAVGAQIVLPFWLRQAGQLCAGLYIGSSLQAQDLSLLQHLALPAVLISSGYFLFSLIFGKLLSSRFGKERKEALLTSTAAGAADMALIAADLGIESANLVAFQIFRWVFVSAVFPPVLYGICHLFG